VSRTQQDLDREYTNLCTEYGSLEDQLNLVSAQIDQMKRRQFEIKTAWAELQSEARALKSNQEVANEAQSNQAS
jgi:chaperonin cofactor prefoldin